MNTPVEVAEKLYTVAEWLGLEKVVAEVYQRLKIG